MIASARVAVERQREQCGQPGQQQGHKKKLGRNRTACTLQTYPWVVSHSLCRWLLLPPPFPAERREEMLKSASRDLTMVRSVSVLVS